MCSSCVCIAEEKCGNADIMCMCVCVCVCVCVCELWMFIHIFVYLLRAHVNLNYRWCGPARVPLVFAHLHSKSSSKSCKGIYPSPGLVHFDLVSPRGRAGSAISGRMNTILVLLCVSHQSV